MANLIIAWEQVACRLRFDSSSVADQEQVASFEVVKPRDGR